MIEKISVTNFKSHAQTEIELGRVTAIVGPNGCGKSTVLQSIYSLNKLVEGIVKHGRWDWKLLSEFIRKGYSDFSISVIGKEPQWKIGVSREAGLSEADHWVLNQEIVTEASKRKLIAEAFGQAVYVKGIGNHSALPSYSNDIPPQIEYDGSGLASVLAYLMTYDRDRLSKIEKALCKIVPSVQQIRARPTKVRLKEKKTFSVNNAQFPYEEENVVVGQELLFDTVSGKEITAQAMSEGTLLTLGLLTALYSSQDQAKLFLLDDVEQGLHPLAQRQMIKTLQEFTEKHDKQILLTSHSGYIVDGLDAKDVWVMTLDSEGISRCKRLSDHHDAERLLQVLTTGELADAVGEDWVIDAPIATGAAND